MLSVVFDHTTTTALHNPSDKANQAVTKFYVEAALGHGHLYAPVLSLLAADTDRPGVLAHITGLRFVTTEPLDAAASLTATELMRAGHSWGIVQAVHLARPTTEHLEGRFVLTCDPSLYEGLGVTAVHPDA
ncbi:hypothetical protein [Streptomyces sp. MNP-20]|uniref:hypothetical protein n=1 Tax=Streptomyces sp. MNP-20 TaxID=2721165 RepID=UPI001552A97F|nr:hypothetical protein [Streptomyces sp. MNP-20]